MKNRPVYMQLKTQWHWPIIYGCNSS